MNASPIGYGHRAILSHFYNHGQRKISNYLSRLDKQKAMLSNEQPRYYHPPSTRGNFGRPLCARDVRCNPLEYKRFSRRNVSMDKPTKQKGQVYVWEQTISAAASASVGDESDDESKVDVDGSSQDMKIFRRKRGKLYRSVDMSMANDPRMQIQQGASSYIGWELVKPTSNRQSDASSNSLFSNLFNVKDSRKSKDLTKIQNLPFVHHFLPANYPHSVSPSYLTYATYCGCGAVAGSAAMVLSTQALLVAVGVGTQSAAPMAAALNWVMKDGLGQLGGVIFASQLGKGGSSTAAQRKNSEGLNSRKSASSAFISSGDSKEKEKTPSAAIAGSNLGDVTAKSGSQAIIASLLGTAIGIFLSQTFCSDHGTAGILTGFIVLSAIHQVCTYKALRAVPLKTLDRHRLHLLLDDYVTKNYQNLVDGKTNGRFKECDVLTPVEIAERESFLPVVSPDDSVRWLSIGAPLTSICPKGIEELNKMLLNSEKYIIKAHLPSRQVGNSGAIQLTFYDGANDTDILRGMYHAYITRVFMSRCDSEQLESYTLVKKTHNLMHEHFPQFLDDLLEGEWQLGSGMVNVECGSSNRLNIQTI
ncbi:hypothetical protein ACHAXS_012504 [Conticribra weissflogii]